MGGVNKYMLYRVVGDKSPQLSSRCVIGSIRSAEDSVEDVEPTTTPDPNEVEQENILVDTKSAAPSEGADTVQLTDRAGFFFQVNPGRKRGKKKKSKQMPQSKLLTGQDFSSHQESRSKTAVQHLNLLYIIYFLLAPTMYNRTPIYRAKPFPLIIPVNRGPIWYLLTSRSLHQTCVCM
eukprot:sb/3471786/